MKKFIKNILIILFCITILNCDVMAEFVEDVATLFHGPKPELEKIPQLTIMQGNISISNSDIFSYPSTGVNLKKSVEFIIKNTGNADLIINSNEGNIVSLSDNETGCYSIIQPSLNKIAPGKTTAFTIIFEPIELGDDFSVNVKLSTNCESNPEFSFSVIGVGREQILINVSPANYTIPGVYTYNFPNNINVPAEIKIYVLGAGGGGQGGHKYSAWLNDYLGTGGAGGGGAAAYIKFIINDKSQSFSITIGHGGTGGAGVRDYFGLGYNGGGFEGTSGGTTTITGFGGVLEVAGGAGAHGGGSHRDGLWGGSGGTIPNKPQNIEDHNWNAAIGDNGGRGEQTANAGDRGGLGGLVNSYRAGKGGWGGYNSAKGGDGGHGRVIIEVTYFD